MATFETRSGSGSSEYAELHLALQAAAIEVRSTMRRTSILKIAWLTLLILGAGFVFDIAFGLPVVFRWLFLIGLLSFIAVSIWRLVTYQRAFRQSDEWAARAVEEQFPDSDSALINGVQFEHILANGNKGGDSEQLMRLEIERAKRTSKRVIESGGIVDKTKEKRALRILLVAATIWVLVALLFPSGFMSVIPRLLAPWEDDVTPPWSATKFDLQPHGANVRFGDSLDIDLTVTGQMPTDVSLMVRSRGQAEWQRLVMSGDEPAHYEATLQSLSEDTQYYVQANTGRSAKYWITVAKPPQVTSVQALYQLPKYTGRPSFSETVSQQLIHGVQGTQVTLTVSSNRELTGGLLTIQTTDSGPSSSYAVHLLPVKDASGEVTGQFQIDRQAIYKVNLTATDGQTSIAATQGKVVLDSNGKPNVWIEIPGRNLIATPSMTIPVQVEAQDQNAIALVRLHRIINDIDDNPVDYPAVGQPKSLTESSVFDLPNLGVQAGDVIKYFAEASDSQPGTPNVGTSETYTVTIVTPEQFQRALEQARTPGKMHAEALDMVAATKRLADEQSQISKEIQKVASQLAKKPNDQALKQQMKDLLLQQKQVQQAAEKLANQMKQYAQSPSGSDFERALKKQVAQAADKIASAAQAMGSSSGASTPSEQAASAAKASSLMNSAINQLAQKVQKPVEQLMKMWRLYRDVRRFFGLLTAQGELVLHSREFQDHNPANPIERADCATTGEQQDQIEHALTQLQADFRVDADNAQDEFPKAAASARQIAAEIDQRRIPQLMSSARDAFRRIDGTTGFQRASEALAQMSAMVQKCNAAKSGQQGDLSDCLSLSLGTKGLGNSLGQMDGQGSGIGEGAGMGVGASGDDDSSDGQPGGMTGFSSQSSPEPYTPQTSFMNGTGGPDKLSHPNTIPGQGAPLSPTDVEVTQQHSGTAAKPGSQNSTSFPATYRKLISDYYRSVANGQ